jgi:nitrogen regulatory protein P-II 1
MVAKAEHQLVVAVIAEALVPKVMDVVRSTGGRSVTVLRGRGRDLVRPPQFLGLPIEPGREVLLLVVEAPLVPRIMAAIEDAGELTQRDRGIAFAMELTHVAGLVAEAIDPSDRPDPA